MKYMGSKRAMLQNGLGDVLGREVSSAPRFVDLFSGSGAVAIHVATNFPVPVVAFDIQTYSAVLAGAVLERAQPLDSELIWNAWKQRAQAQVGRVRPPSKERLTQAVVSDFRLWCDDQTALPITKAYGGYYFSPQQAVWLDALLAALPKRNPVRRVALAAVIQAASACVASPGHTAQPFQPTRTAKRFLAEAWERDVVSRTQKAFELLAAQCARQIGVAQVADANKAAEQLEPGDVVFIDPPYSGVHYSRFYHVLETIARGEAVEVSGRGRYPAPTERPWSRYSVQTEAAKAFDELLATIAERGARAIVTFPEHRCSNGLSGRSVRTIAEKHFRIASHSTSVISRFSTLGGTSGAKHLEGGRAARQQAKELMLVLEPR
jgi:adenine-specific DNA-methyltransferase